MLGYYLQPHHLGPIWDDMVETSAQLGGLHNFRELQLFFGAKGTKLLFKLTLHWPTLLDVLKRFQLYLANLVNMDLVNKD